MSKKINRIGEIRSNKHGTKMKIIEYINNKNVLVEFQDEYKYKTKVCYYQFDKGSVENLYDKTVFGIGMQGEGKYQQSIKGVNTIYYKYWYNMMDRCYRQLDNYAYKDVTVCEEWHNFQNFAKWVDENYYEIEDETMQLDKDILIKGNNIYSPEVCVFVPLKINYLFIKAKKNKGDYPTGVSFDKNRQKFMSGISINNKRVSLGRFDTIEDAFYSYKQAKEQYIKQVADEYRDKIPKKLYEAMYRWEVNIDD